MGFLKTLVTILGAIAIIIVFNSVMNYFGVKLSNYLIYIGWFVGILILYVILPRKFKFFGNE
tara:strand:- start:9538 stop:9723 length:186 start_codon:yes stop_codon:yes gene_type:complete